MTTKPTKRERFHATVAAYAEAVGRRERGPMNPASVTFREARRFEIGTADALLNGLEPRRDTEHTAERRGNIRQRWDQRRLCTRKALDMLIANGMSASAAHRFLFSEGR